MKKKIVALILSAALALSLAACGENGGGSGQTQSPTPDPIPDLSGEWKQVGGNSDDTYHGIYISGDTIEIYWVTESDGTTALYWAGSFKAPTDSTEPYKWVSENDHSKTGMALLASGDDTKEFTYENGQISYSAAAFGVTTTVKAEKAEWGYSGLGGGSASEESAPIEDSDSPEGSPQGQEAGPAGDIGNHHVEIKDAFLAEDYNGNPAIVVTYAWTNNSEETTTSMTTVTGRAYQDGVELDMAILIDVDGYDAGTTMKNVKPGATIDVQWAYSLSNETSVVEFEVTDWLGLTGEMVSTEFDLSELGQ